MNNEKIGRFIAQKRKENNLTQAQLAEKLFLSDRAISKWERGKSMPDAAIMNGLCGILGITLSELFAGEELSKNERPEALEEQLLALKKGNEESAKTLLRVEWLITIPVLVISLAGILTSAFYTEFHPDFWPWAIAIMVASLLLILIVAFVALRIEQKAGFYVCPKCGHKFVPSYGKVFVAPHVGTTRYMKCPRCHSKGWCKKTTEP